MISGGAKLAGIVGWPVAHSLSPRLHGYWIAEHKLDAAYVPLPVRAEDFADAFAALPKLGFRGVNVTLPHKEAAFRATQDHDAAAVATGAVNTVVFENGRAVGRNTDVSGVSMMLRDGGITTLSSETAVVLGAGGGSRAVIAALLSLGAAKVVLVNRTVEKARTLGGFFGDRVVPAAWSDASGALKSAALLVNATSLGMTGQPPLEIDLAALPARGVVADIVYKPLETPLLGRAKARGLKAIDGLGMLLHQAVPAFHAWFGVDVKVTPALRAHLVAALEGRS
jgi:shikimate dehydrogenase